ncbi:glutathione-regulated potassium-efflux system ancillary protein KefG [Fibrobacter sp. UWB16]|uniref:NAD(P)H-dependent oxidoreductase n=1 Tax=unclassified Fibrobacter TaxID=2634177 RepID=UPI000B5243F3|nr:MULTISPECIES: NAD(P)H-dependent oxidoreductase [unclassified Fibrobacter]OWV18587.1 NAD(P)H dehydrogenase [Fibrobacter sp. UWB3]SOD13447.1 glutathione-regulated potassium-efflux system ancillary protein KefG [Fibrobacter sp. UWB16]
MNNQITILLSHPNISNSMFNKHLVDINRKNPNFVFHHLDKNRVNGYFDLEAEKKLLRESKAIVWQFPIYWYNSPSSLRDWQDQIMSPIVYSADNFLKGMPVRVVFTAGAAAEHYTHEGLNRYTAEEMLIPFEMTANAAGMKWFKPLGFYGCSPDMTKAALDKAAKEYEESLLELL